MKQLQRGDKIYLDQNNTDESLINTYLDCRDGIVECYEYCDSSGYGSKTRLFLCRNTKHESVSIIRQSWIESSKTWSEDYMDFDSDSFTFMEALIKGKNNEGGGTYTLVRDC